ncbi:SurA N-terminal domain-containing protein [Nonomuraea roseoviolacea]|uniref:Peptidyl-prolyl cis-trans isomerase SurA n=1 Tax=Nonomuraea roseoviolacea subsp. carminata TaxID=160689 RepID=A0ABT1K2X6_9ACTN|nr:SurA N-terminal domain-containing protein [Nonomuraea roseoviolacea]MCP2348345.1 peptidyl-prolyl cis-trans isomerase SurA [Nonomuraea roseoviolacea subsp. carminata]
MKSIRMAVAAAAAGASLVALTACSAPVEAGAAAVVGNERISAGDLKRNVKEYDAALTKTGLTTQALGIPGSTTEVVLYQLANIAQAEQLVRKAKVNVTDAEVDQAIGAATQQGGSFEQYMVSQGMAPSNGRRFMRVSVGLQKLMAQYGGGTDQAAQQRGSERIQKEAAAIKITYSPRYGVVNAQRSQTSPGLFADAGRFGKAATQNATQQQG